MSPKVKTSCPKKRKIEKPKKVLFKYSEEALKMALVDIRSGKMGNREASRFYGVPRTTIQDRLSGRVVNKSRKIGLEPLLTFNGESKVSDWIIAMAKCGFPVTKDGLISTVMQIVKGDSNMNGKIFKNGTPGQKWYSNFLKRHPEISIRQPEAINKARAIITEENIRNWFTDLSNYSKENNLEDVVQDPSRIFNGDETGFSLSPKSGKVLAPKGCTNLYTVKFRNEKENITVLITFSASGKICPPLVVYPYVRPPRVLMESMPDSWVLGKSGSGWMTSEVFYEYIANEFNGWLEKNQIKKPIILFIDGHRSHMSLPLSEFCNSNGIVLYALPPNTTHLLQPADVSVFRPLKCECKKTVCKWQSEPENINSSVTKLNFCRLLEKTLINSDISEAIRNGFQKCGLYPLDPNNVDYSKCVQNALERQNCPTDTVITSKEFEITKKVLRKIGSQLGEKGIELKIIFDELNKMKIMDSPSSCLDPRSKFDMEVIEDRSIQNVDINNNSGSIISLDDVTMISMIPDTIDICDVPIEIYEIPENESLPQFLNGSSMKNSKEQTAVDNSQRTEEQTKQQFQSTIKEPKKHTTVDVFAQHLVFPKPIGKSSKTQSNKRKLPSAISSASHREFLRQEDDIKAAKEKEIKQKKLERLERSEKKKKEQEERKKRKIKQTKKGNKSTLSNKDKLACNSCNEELDSDAEADDEKNIGCDYCFRWYHLRCTKFSGESYEAVASKEYKCDNC